MLNIIPLPYFFKENYGEFIINAHTTIYADEVFTFAKNRLMNMISDACGFKLRTLVDKKAAINILEDKSLVGEEYALEATSESLRVRAGDSAGALYAVETLRQLLNADAVKKAEVLTMHAVEIEDKPRYKWRGLLLDESRHFFGAAFVKRLLELMAMHKLNVLHWHLTDTPGWRVEIKKYPRLTEIGSVRKGTQYLAWRCKNNIENVPYGGFYTQDDIRDIVAYAARLNIMIVPEVDMPAHFSAAIAAYPHLSCRDVQTDVPVGFSDPITNIIACAGKESTYKFIYDVIDELSALFPAPYFHIGGDEAPKQEWKRCPLCQKEMKENGIKTEEDLQGWFNNKIALYLRTKGKKLIGWNEILRAENLNKNVVAQYWTPGRDKRCEEYLKRGGDMIISKYEAFYFDMPYAYVNLKSTYCFNAENYGLKDADGGILGVEGALWTEWVRTPERAEYQLFPRMEALSETAWSKESVKNYADFRKRLKKFLPILDKYKVVYAHESMVDVRGLRAKRIERIFRKKNAHIEFRKAIALRPKEG